MQKKIYQKPQSLISLWRKYPDLAISRANSESDLQETILWENSAQVDQPHEGDNMHYTLIRSSRRTLSISIGQDGEALVRAPMKYSEVKIEAFLREKSSWIEKQKKKWSDRQIQMAENTLCYHLF
jgi:uncharacterized protein YeaC (DUF1315 family)